MTTSRGYHDDRRPGRPAPPVAGTRRGHRAARRRRAVHRGDARQGAVVAAGGAPGVPGEDAPVLLSSDPNHPMVKARLAAGAKLISAPGPQPGAAARRRRDDGHAADLRARGRASRRTIRCGGICSRRPTSCSTRCAAATPMSFVRSSETCCCRCCFTPASPRTRRSGRSPSTTSPTRWCASSPTGYPRCLRENRSHWRTSSPSGRSARRSKSQGAIRSWTTCPPDSPPWR